MLVKKKGFTLVELLVVIAIIGILVAMVIIAIDPLRVIRESRDSKDRSELSGVKSALQLYLNEHNNYPLDPPGLTGVLNPTYIRTMPSATITYSETGTDYLASIPVNHVIQADRESELRCTGADTQTIGASGTFYICAD